jgi:two-component system, LuxR family, response regulator FixJ
MATAEVLSAKSALVYIVDDDPAVRKSLQWLIESVGLHVECHHSAADFLSQFDPEKPGCVVLDVRMPGMSGLELQERIREMGSAIPIIIMTAYGDVPMAVRAMKMGAVYFFEKPLSDQVLLDQIQLAITDDIRRRNEEDSFQEIRQRFKTLTSRECEIFDQVALGLSSKQIGTELHVSFKTVEAHRAKIMRKMQAESIPHLIKMHIALNRTRNEPPA